MHANKEERINIKIKICYDDEKKNPLEIFCDRRYGNKSLSTQFQEKPKHKAEKDWELI